MKKDEILIIFKLLLIKNNAYERYILSLRTLHKPNGIDIKHFTNTTRSTDWIFVAFGWLNENKMYNDFVNWSEMHKNIMEDRIILFKLFLIKRNIYEKFIKAFKYAHADSNFENYLLTNVEECYSDLILYAFPWGTVNRLYKDVCDNWDEVSTKWAYKSKLINNLLKK